MSKLNAAEREFDTQRFFVYGFEETWPQNAIDPTYGLNETGTSSAGSCMAACTKISTTNISGQCCVCSGVSKKWAQSTFSTSVYACR